MERTAQTTDMKELWRFSRNSYMYRWPLASPLESDNRGQKTPVSRRIIPDENRDASGVQTVKV